MPLPTPNTRSLPNSRHCEISDNKEFRVYSKDHPYEIISSLTISKRNTGFVFVVQTDAQEKYEILLEHVKRSKLPQENIMVQNRRAVKLECDDLVPYGLLFLQIIKFLEPTLNTIEQRIQRIFELDLEPVYYLPSWIICGKIIDNRPNAHLTQCAMFAQIGLNCVISKIILKNNLNYILIKVVSPIFSYRYVKIQMEKRGFLANPEFLPNQQVEFCIKFISLCARVVDFLIAIKMIEPNFYEIEGQICAQLDVFEPLNFSPLNPPEPNLLHFKEIANDERSVKANLQIFCNDKVQEKIGIIFQKTIESGRLSNLEIFRTNNGFEIVAQAFDYANYSILIYKIMRKGIPKPTQFDRRRCVVRLQCENIVPYGAVFFQILKSFEPNFFNLNAHLDFIFGIDLNRSYDLPSWLIYGKPFDHRLSQIKQVIKFTNTGKGYITVKKIQLRRLNKVYEILIEGNIEFFLRLRLKGIIIIPMFYERDIAEYKIICHPNMENAILTLEEIRLAEPHFSEIESRIHKELCIR